MTPKETCIEKMSVAMRVTDMDFNSLVVLMLDRNAGKLGNLWVHEGHPDSWGAKELSEISQQMCSYAAESLKSEVNTGERKLDVRTRDVAMGPYESKSGSTVLFCWGKALKGHPTVRRLWLWAELAEWDFGLCASVRKMVQGEHSYRSVMVILGPFSFRATWPL